MSELAHIKAVDAASGQTSSLHQDLLGQLRDYFIESDLIPGSRVPERELCAKFAVSRTPLREALKVLAFEGFLELLPNRGARIRQFSEPDIRNMFEVIAGLDFLAGRLACARISDDAIGEIEQMHLQMYSHYLRHELSDYFHLNQRIHQAIVDGAGNPLLSTHYSQLNAVVRRLRYAANLVHRDRLSEAMREHEAIVDALRRRAGDELAQLMYEHMLRKCDAVCEYFASHQQPVESQPLTA